MKIGANFSSRPKFANLEKKVNRLAQPCVLQSVKTKKHNGSKSMNKRSGSRVLWALHQKVDIDMMKTAQYVQVVELFLARQLDALMKQAASEMDSADPDDRQAIAEFYMEDGSDFGHEFPQIFREAIFVAVYSQLEHYLMAVCRYFERERPEAVLLEDLQHHKGITQAKVYLKKVVGLPFPSEQWPWQEIEK